MKKGKIAFHIVGMLVVAALFLLLLGFEEVQVENRVEPIGMRLPEWLGNFRFWGRFGIAMSLLAGLVWYLFAQRKLIDRLNDSRRRWVWVLLFLLPAFATGAAVYFTKPVQAGAWWANGFYCLNALAVYYLETALFSPSAFKYTPIGAWRMRVWDRISMTRTMGRTKEGQ